MPAKVILEITSGPMTDKRFVFDEHDTFLFGRHKDCHAFLPDDPRISRHHFILETIPPAAQLRDLGSRNGTIINGVKFGGRAPDEGPEEGASYQHPTVGLKDGDRIQVGRSTIQVRVQIPVLCARCGTELDGKTLTGDAENSVCSACRNVIVEGIPLSAQRVATTCDHCGRDVSDELGNGQHGKYVCRECRARFSSHANGARDLLREILRKMQSPAQPQIEGYEVQEKLGEGGMGVVYKASRERDGATVAIKLMLSEVAVDEAARKMFLREVDVTRKLSHPNVVQLLDHGASGGAFYFVMDYCSGGSIDRWMAKHGGKLPLSVAAPMMLQVMKGLQHAHECGIVHRDLKPPNLLLHQSEKEWVARVSDFGLAKCFEQAGFSGMTATRGMGGTPCFMPREQLTHYREVRPVSDVWSIAATFFNMLTGALPRKFRNDADPIQVILNESPIPIRKLDKSIPAKLAAVIDRALLDDISNRYQTVAEFQRELRSAL